MASRDKFFQIVQHRNSLGRFASAATTISEELLKQGEDALELLGEEIVRDVRAKIESNIPPPLSPKTKSGDPRPLIDSRRYINALHVNVEPSLSDRSVRISASPGDSEELTRIGRAHEFGIPSSAVPNLPARPHWAPVIRRLPASSSYQSLASGRFLSLRFLG